MDGNILKALSKYNYLIDKMVIIIEIASKNGTKNFLSLISLDNYKMFLKHLYIERG